jgi:uncharacterized membrane protein
LQNRLQFTGLVVLSFFAIVIGVVSLRYAIPHVPFPTPIPNFRLRHPWLIAHAITASIALLIGPWQFFSGFRARHMTVHRWFGRVYCIAVTAAWLTSLPIAAHAQFGAVSSAGFLTLGLFWITSTAFGYFTIRQGQVTRHREWMIRSYALTAAAITLRIYLPIATLSGIQIPVAYPAIAWLCWIPNLLFAEYIIRKTRGNTLIAAQA